MTRCVWDGCAAPPEGEPVHVAFTVDGALVERDVRVCGLHRRFLTDGMLTGVSLADVRAELQSPRAEAMLARQVEKARELLPVA